MYLCKVRLEIAGLSDSVFCFILKYEIANFKLKG